MKSRWFAIPGRPVIVGRGVTGVGSPDTDRREGLVSNDAYFDVHSTTVFPSTVLDSWWICLKYSASSHTLFSSPSNIPKTHSIVLPNRRLLSCSQTATDQHRRLSLKNHDGLIRDQSASMIGRHKMQGSARRSTDKKSWS